MRWLSPECISAKALSLQSDVYAFGLTMWEIFTLGAQMPFMDTPEPSVSRCSCCATKLAGIAFNIHPLVEYFYV